MEGVGRRSRSSKEQKGIWLDPHSNEPADREPKRVNTKCR